MTKTELLADLAARFGVEWVGNPGTKTGDTEDGGNIYSVIYRKAGDVASYPSVKFVVIDEGGTEDARYMQPPPKDPNEPLPELTGAAATAIVNDITARGYNWVGTPRIVDADKGEGTVRLCRVEYAQKYGMAGDYLYVDFYALANDTIIYKGSPPKQRTRPNELEEWMIGIKDGNPENYKGLTVIWKSERWEQIVYAHVTGAPLVAKYFYIKKGSAPVEITGTVAEKELFIQALQASRFNI